MQKALYHVLRDKFKPAAQLAVRCLGKVADAYNLDKKTKRTFKPHGSMPYDNRILNCRQQTETVSIWVLGGRESIPY